MPTRKRTWGLLPPSGLIDGSQAPKLLGRIIADIDYPTADYQPADPRVALHALPAPLEVIDADTKTVLSQVKNTKAKLDLGKIFGVHASDNTNNEDEVTSKTVVTRTLPQYRHAFKALMGNHRDDILELLNNNGGKAYFIVGVKTCLDSEISHLNFSTSAVGGNVEFPLGQLLAAAGGIPPPLAPDAANPSGSLDRETVRKALYRFVATGERIFSLQVREVKLGYWDTEPSVRDLHEFSDGTGTFAPGGDAEDAPSKAFVNELPDDELEDDEINEELEKEGLSIGGGEIVKPDSQMVFL